ncbi:ABC transporter substrate-binding protein [Mycolicibacterium frederiksbergense]|uniref:ABC transporter substrate-binding protein n=1 Tax=Mycolicibacterium frederiksbergense TaxID=117567 RepID=UPI00143A23A3|nr:ABC transporter substrate-binding protein [Mycolicibacterium frederiksbergense]
MEINGSKPFRAISRRRFGVLAATTGVALTAAACGNQDAGGAGGGSQTTLKIAYQPNFGYAPLMVLKSKGWLQESLPNWDVSYQTVNSGALIRSGMISGDIQVGALALSPFLVGWDKGLDWKIVSALSDIDQWLMAKDPRIDSLADFTPSDKIAVLSADNNQAILLRIAAKQQLGNADALKVNEVYMPHDTGTQSLLTGRVAAQFTNPPYQFKDRDAGARRILGSHDIFGGPDRPIFGAVAVRQPYIEDNPDVIEALRTGISRAADFITSDPDESAAILAAEFGEDASTISAQLHEPSVTFTSGVTGVQAMAEAMQAIGVIKTTPSSDSEVISTS